MPRKRVSKGQIIMKKQEKLPVVAAAMEEGFTDEEFIEKFKEMYPKEWANVERRYRQHEDLNKGKKKGHPMAPPRQYLLNVSKQYINQRRNQLNT